MKLFSLLVMILSALGLTTYNSLQPFSYPEELTINGIFNSDDSDRHLARMMLLAIRHSEDKALPSRTSPDMTSPDLTSGFEKSPFTTLSDFDLLNLLETNDAGFYSRLEQEIVRLKELQSKARAEGKLISHWYLNRLGRLESGIEKLHRLERYQASKSEPSVHLNQKIALLQAQIVAELSAIKSASS